MSLAKRITVVALAVAALASAAGCGPIGFGQDGATTSYSGGGSVPVSCASNATGYGAPVDTYVVAPVFVAAWWYIGQEPPEVAAGEQYIDEEPPPSDPGYYPGDPGYYPSDPGDPEDPQPDDSAPGGSNDQPADPPADPGDPGTQSDDVAAPDAGDASDDQTDDSVDWEALHPKDLGGACYSCDLTCTLESPDVSQPAALRTIHGTSAHSQGAACADAERTLRHYASSSYGLNLNTCGYTTGQ